MTRYKDKQMDRIYTASLAAAHDRTSELYFTTQDGLLIRHTGAGHRCAFWNGYDSDVRGPMEPRGTLAAACFAAGRAFRKVAPDWAQEAAGRKWNNATKEWRTSRARRIGETGRG